MGALVKAELRERAGEQGDGHSRGQDVARVLAGRDHGGRRSDDEAVGYAPVLDYFRQPLALRGADLGRVGRHLVWLLVSPWL